MKYTILIILIIVSIAIAFTCGYINGKDVTMSWALEEQIKTEERHINSLNEFTQNYNELYSEYNRLYKEYKDCCNIHYQDFIVTGYSANDPEQGTTNLLKTGFNLDYECIKNLPIVAVDPNIIPLYSIIEIKDVGYFIALDTGYLIKGNRVDILFDTKEEAFNFGVKTLPVGVVK